MRLITRQGRVSEEHQPKCVLSSIYLQASCGLISHQLAGPPEMVKVTSMERWKHSAITKINNQTPHTKSPCSPASLPAIHTPQESSCFEKQRVRPRKQAHKAHHKHVQGLPNLHHTMRCSTTAMPHLLILCRYFSPAVISTKYQTVREAEGKCQCPLWHKVSPDDSLEQLFCRQSLEKPCSMWSMKRAVRRRMSPLIWMPPWDVYCWIAHLVSLENTTID